MSLDKSTIEIIMTSILFLGGAIYVVAQAYNGRSQKKSDDVTTASRTMELFKDRIEALELNLKAAQAEIEKLKIDLRKEQDHGIALQQQINIKDETIKQLRDLLQNRDPEMKELLVDLRVVMQDVRDELASRPKDTKVTVTHS